MMLINIHKIFENAIIEENIDTLEKILSASDSRIDLIEEFSKNHDLSILKRVILSFRSKGLIKDIQESCELVTNRRFNFKDKNNKEFKSFKARCIHLDNIETNKIKYLQEDTFTKNKIKKEQ